MKTASGKDAASPPRASEASKPAPEAPTKADDPLQARIKTLEDERDRLKSDLADFRDRFLRARADYENVARRAQKESLDSVRAAKGALLLRFAATCESLERAHKDLEKGSPEAAKGVKLVLDEIRRILKDEGVKEVETSGPFNYRYHQAVETIETNQHAEGTIVDVVQRGYLLGGEVLRHALVRVAAAPRKAAHRPESAASS